MNLAESLGIDNVNCKEMAERGQWITGKPVSEMTTSHLLECIQMAHLYGRDDKDAAEAMLPLLYEEIKKRGGVAPEPCHFCHSFSYVIWPFSNDICCVECSHCDARGPVAEQGDFESAEECEQRAIRYWNEGVKPDELEEENSHRRM